VRASNPSLTVGALNEMSAVSPPDAPEFAGRQALFRAMCAGMVVFLLIVSAGFWLIVTYALDGVPLAGNRLLIEGVPVVTIVATMVTVIVPFIAWRVGRAKGDAAVRRMLRDHPEVVGPDADAERLMNAVAGRVFGTHAVLVGVGFAWAILLHLTSSPGLLGCIGVVVAVMVAWHPTAGRVRRWYGVAAADLARLRDGR